MSRCLRVLKGQELRAVGEVTNAVFGRVDLADSWITPVLHAIVVRNMCHRIFVLLSIIFFVFTPVLYTIGKVSVEARDPHLSWPASGVGGKYGRFLRYSSFKGAKSE